MAHTVIYTLSLHDALPIFAEIERKARHKFRFGQKTQALPGLNCARYKFWAIHQSRFVGGYAKVVHKLPRSKSWYSIDRKSTRLNSSHANISYAVFCLKKKK